MEVSELTARIAGWSRSKPADYPPLVAARAELAARRVMKAINADRDQLTPAARETLAASLTGGDR